MSSYATLGVGPHLQFAFCEVTNSFHLNDVYFHFIRALPRQNSRCAWRIFNAMTLITTPSRLIIWRLDVSMLSLCFWCSTVLSRFQFVCRENKTNLWPIEKDTNNPLSQSNLQANTWSRPKVRKNGCGKSIYLSLDEKRIELYSGFLRLS